MGEKINILIIEDSEDDACLIIRKLKKEGFEPFYIRVESAPGMIKALEEKNWDIIISDYSLPGFSGLAALKISKENTTHIPFIIVSGVIGEDKAVEAMKAGAHDYIMKDNLKRLAPAIKRELTEIRTRRKAEDALRKSEERFKLAMEATSDGIWDWNLTTGELYLSSRYYTMLGYEADEFIPSFEKWMSLIHPCEVKTAREKAGKLREGKAEILEDEFRLKTKNGGWKWILTRGKIVERNKDGIPVRAVGTHVDITERKEAEEALREMEERNRALLNAMPDLMFLQNKEGVFLDYSAQDLNMLFTPPEKFLNKNIKEVMPPEFAEKLSKLLEEALKTKKVQHLEYSLPIKDKNEYFELRMVACDGDKILSIVRNISEQKKLEEQLKQAQKLESLGVLAGGIAHDFNNILTSILGYAELAVTELTEGSIERESVEQITTSAHRAAELIKQMLAYSGKGKFFVKSINLPGLIEETIENIDASILKNCRVIYEFEKDLPAMEGDKAQLRQLIKSLVINSAEAINNFDGVITISSGEIKCDRKYLSKNYLDDNLPEGLYVFLEVKDNGCGMTEEVQEKIFDPFFSTKFTGRGLGLAAALGIVRSHQGGIKVLSSPDRGTKFKIIFPASGRIEKKITLKKIKNKILQSTGAILVIDDDKAVCRVTENILKKLGFNVFTALNGKDGIEVFHEKSGEISLVLLDMKMPDMTGEETLPYLKNINNNIPVILSSGYNEDEGKNNFKKKGFSAYIQKPYKVNELMDTIYTVINSY